MMTFKDLFNFATTANRDQYGYTKSGSEEFVFHIYDGFRQINICKTTDRDPICNIILDRDYNDVMLVNVINGVSDYDHQSGFSIDTQLPIYINGINVAETFQNIKTAEEIEAEMFVEKTECTLEQARYLVAELKKLPKVHDIIINHAEDMNLFGCESVEVVRVNRYMDDNVNICGQRLDDQLTFTLAGQQFKNYKHYKYSFSSYAPDRMGYDIY